MVPPTPPHHQQATGPRRTNQYGEEIHEFVVRLDRTLYEQVRDRAHSDHMSMADVIRSALRRYL